MSNSGDRIAEGTTGPDKSTDSTYSEDSGQGYGSSGARNVEGAPVAFQPEAKQTEGQMKPKGKNLHEVEDLEGGENASMEYGNEIGGPYDPGRQAERAFSARPAAGNATYPSVGKEGSKIDQRGYDNLNTEESA